MGKRAANLILVAAVLAVCGTSWGQKKASDPDPADGATDVTTPLLRWVAGSTAVWHEVYLGTTPDLGPAQLASPRFAGPAYLYYPLGFPAGVVFYWRVDEVEADGVTVHTGDVWMFMGQPETAFWPEPADGSNAGPLAPSLTWNVGQAAQQHHVYFGDSEAAVAAGDPATDMGIVDDPNYAPGELQPLTMYWWRVDEILPMDEVKPGPVWSFTTFLPVDDFESYNDEENQGTRIYETWLDGYSDGSSGSVVGNLDPPFAEQTIIRSGQQSMPFEYNNVSTPFFSEARIEFSPLADWTVDEVNTLTLHVRGQAIDFEVPSVSTPPVLDGQVDDVWSQASVQYIKATINGAAPTDLADCSGLFRVLYDTTNLYVLVDVNDATLVQDSDPTQGWLDDRIEIFIDGDNDKTAANDTVDDYQYCFRWNHGTVETPVEWYSSPRSLTGVEYGITATARSYLVEVKLPWSTMIGGPAKAGRLIGIDVVIDDDDDGGDTMDSQVAWHLPTGSPHRPVYWGTAQLADQAKPSDLLYVMLQDSANHEAVVTYPDQAVLKSADWVEWQIPLSDFAGVSLTNVRWLYVGVGDRDNPVVGGAGKLFFDDIYLTRPAPVQP